MWAFFCVFDAPLVARVVGFVISGDLCREDSTSQFRVATSLRIVESTHERSRGDAQEVLLNSNLISVRFFEMFFFLLKSRFHFQHMSNFIFSVLACCAELTCTPLALLCRITRLFSICFVWAFAVALCGGALLELGWEKVPNWERMFVHRKEGLFLSVYVDDVEMAGKKQNMAPMWKKLMKKCGY